MCHDDDAEPTYGSWELGIKITPTERVFRKLHQKLSDLNSLGKIDAVFFEQPLDPRNLKFTNAETTYLQTGLAAHADSWAGAMGCRIIRPVHHSSWVKFFLGSMPRGTERKTLKECSLERCRQLGFKPKNDDEADALGILDYSYEYRGVMPPWRKDEVLRPVMEALA